MTAAEDHSSKSDVAPLRFTLSLRNIEDLLEERGVAVSYGGTATGWTISKFNDQLATTKSMAEDLARLHISTKSYFE